MAMGAVQSKSKTNLIQWNNTNTIEQKSLMKFLRTQYITINVHEYKAQLQKLKLISF